MVLNLEISDKISIRDGILRVGSQALTSYRLTRELPPGAHGRVFEGEHRHFGPCVVKLWIRKDEDWQSRFLRAMEEVTKAARATPQWSVEMYDAHLIENVFLCSMQLVPGKTLKEVLQGDLTDELRWQLAEQYVEAIIATRNTIHGDAHTKNVMVDWVERGGIFAPKVTLIDFGASWYETHSSSHDRHWKVVGETIHKIVCELPNFSEEDSTLLKRGLETDYKAILKRLQPPSAG
jgi:serine/threonine protein kinase